MIRVLLADDQELVRNGFRLILEVESDLQVVGEVADGRAAVTAARSLQPDVILMDIRMPILDGIRATAQIVAQAAGTPVPRIVILTTFDSSEYVYDALRAGASGFLLKDARRDQLVDAIRLVARGDELFAPSVLRRLVETFVRQPAPGAANRSDLSNLTEREREVLILLAKGLSNAEIAQHLVLSGATAKTHVGRVLTKLALRDRTHAVIFSYELGLVRPGDTSLP
jgi:DNA-binding NarL/FixJ family response regulator